MLVWFVLTVFLAAWTLWFQAYIYTESTSGMLWRAPAAGSCILLTILLWVFLDYQNPERYSTLWEFSPVEDHDYQQIIVPHRDGKEDVYKRVRRDRSYVYMRGDRPLPTRPEKVIAVTDSGERIPFEPDRDASGHFQVEDGRSLIYRGPGGLTMVEGQLGRIRTFYPGRLFLNLFLNFFHFLIWFVSLWLILRYQWSHAFGLAIVLWAVMILFILPQVLRLAEDAALHTSAPAAQSTQPTVPAAPATRPAGQ
jgi:hypothetical protein